MVPSFTMKAEGIPFWAAAFIQAHTAPRAIFLTSDNHNNPVSALAGRNVYWGPGVYLFFHGIDERGRERTVTRMLTSPAAFRRLAPLAGIDYVYISSYERQRLKVAPEFFRGRYPEVFHDGETTIFAISAAARQAMASR